ncbi:MAG: pseudouridine-5'-phosphate glycosidase [Anaerolineae bacterium]|nr:pseudouridine-5'-phosphate glycosidase [Anaerolineae bacterium]
MNIQVSSEVQAALRAGKPVVALESAVITHGLPRPQNLDTARHLERIVREHGAVPATVAVLGGKPCVGLRDDELVRLAESPRPRKVSLRDLAACAVRGEDGGTTVAATMHLAHGAGIRVFATGGIGGVHRGQPFDVSADLPALARIPMAIVCSGAKSILDLPLTLEWLETHGVPVVGYQTDRFPAFYCRDSGLPVDIRVDTPEALADFVRAHRDAGLSTAVLVGVPVPEDSALPDALVEEAIARALAEAEREGVRGKAITPYLLARVSQITEGRSLEANLALLARNAEVGARLAVCLAQG